MKSKISELCKNYKNIYINSAAEWVIVIWMIIPLMWGIINYTMLLDKYYYDAYVYSDCLKIVVALVLSIALIMTFLFTIVCCYLGKTGISGVFKTICKNEKWLIFWMVLPAWSIVCICCSVNKVGALLGEAYLAEGYMGHLFGLALMVCASFVRGRKEREKVLNLFCIITNILACIMLGYEYSVPFLRGFTAATGVSVYTNSNHFGYVLAMAILVMAGMYFMYYQNDIEVDKKVRRKKIAFYICSFTFNSFALMVNNTLGAYLAVIFGLVFLMIIWGVRTRKLSLYHFIPYVIIIVLTVISFAGLIDNELGGAIGKSLVGFVYDLLSVKHKSEGYRNAGSLRMGLWLDSLDAIWKRPILGYGPGVRYDLEWNEIINTLPHNEYIECALFLGIPGLILYMGGLIGLCVDRCRKLKSLDYTDIVAAGALVAYLISAFVGARRFYTSPYMFVFLGMLIKWGKGKKTDNGNEADVQCEEAAEVILTQSETESNTEKTLQEEKAEEDEKQTVASDKKKNGIFTRLEIFGISKACAYILLAWTVIPFIAAIGFIPIGLKHAAEGVLLNTYYQIMYNFSIVCVIGIVGFILFMIILSGKRDTNPMTTKQIIIDKTKQEVWIVLLIALLFWSFISACLSDDVVTSFIGTALKRDGFLAYCMYASVFGLAYFIGDNRWIKRFLICYSAIASIMCLVMMFYEWQIPVLVYMSHSFSCATFMNPNHFGYYLGMSIMCLFGLYFMDLYRAKESDEKVISKIGIYYIVSFGWQVYAMMINNSLGTFVGIVCAIIISMIFWKIRFGRLGLFAWIPGIIVVIITFMSYMGWINNLWGETVGESLTQFVLDLFIVAEHAEGFEKAGTNRIGLWIETLKLIPHRPIFGYGPEGLTGHFQDVNTYDRPHNEYLQLAVFCGVPALLMYLSALITLCVDRCKRLKAISPVTIAVAGVVLGYLANAFFGFTLYYTTPYYFMFLGFVAGSVKDKIE